MDSEPHFLRDWIVGDGYDQQGTGMHQGATENEIGTTALRRDGMCMIEMDSTLFAET